MTEEEYEIEMHGIAKLWSKEHEFELRVLEGPSSSSGPPCIMSRGELKLYLQEGNSFVVTAIWFGSDTRGCLTRTPTNPLLKIRQNRFVVESDSFSWFTFVNQVTERQ
jgi:hypothetical protein